MAIATGPAWDASEVPPLPVHRFSVDEYHRMAEAGILAEGDRVELLEGWIVRQMVRNSRHDGTVGLVQEALRARLPEGWWVRVQSAITTGDSEPEPDLVVLRGPVRAYVGRHPGPQDLALVIEVADSSIDYDRGLKARIYARAGVPIYWVVNLVDGQVEVYGDPTGPGAGPAYRAQQVVKADGVLPLVIEGREVGRIPARELLPRVAVPLSAPYGRRPPEH
jgi:Uma2 family endonuclease